MKSNRKKVEALISGAVDFRLEESGLRMMGGIMAEIVDQDLVDTGAMLGDVQFHTEGREVRAGNTLDDPPYPFFLNNGFIHWISGELVGPYRFMEKGTSRAEGDLRRVWQEPIRGKRL